MEFNIYKEIIGHGLNPRQHHNAIPNDLTIFSKRQFFSAISKEIYHETMNGKPLLI